MVKYKFNVFLEKILFLVTILALLGVFSNSQIIERKNLVKFQIANAQNNNTNTPIQDSSTGKNLVEYSGVQSTIEDYLCKPNADGYGLVHCVNKLYRLGVAVGAMLLVFFMVLAGYLYITGGENGKTKAKELIYSTLTGIGVLLTSFLLLNFINPSLTTFKPIQPPIFSAAELASCQDLGFEGGCILASDDPGLSSAFNPGGENSLSAAELKERQEAFEREFKPLGVKSKSEWGGKVPTQALIGNPKPNTIVVHHTAGSSDTPQSIESFHMSKWSDIAYHFIIAKNGTIYQGRYGGPTVMGAHAKGANSGSVGIVMVGNYENESPTQASIASLEKLVRSLKQKYNANTVTIHKKVGSTSTACPGKNMVPVVARISYLNEMKVEFVKGRPENYRTQTLNEASSQASNYFDPPFCPHCFLAVTQTLPAT